MKKAIFYIIIFSISISCKNGKKEIEPALISGSKDTLAIEKRQDSVESSIITKPQTSETLRETGVVYVTAESGLTYREKPDVNSEKQGKFELGSKLSVLEKTGIYLRITDEQKNIEGEWIMVESKRDKWHKGYVFSGFVIDSTEADFSKLPVDISYEFSFPQTQIEYQEIDLEFTKTTLSEFNEHQKSNNTENKDYNEPKPLKSEGNPQQGGYFILEINERLYKFPCGSGYSRPCYTYQGFNQYLNAYSIGQHGDGIFQTFYLDKDDGSIFRINSPYDDGNYGLYISPTRKRLVSVSSIDYDRFKEFYGSRSVIIIYDVENVKSFSEIKKANIFSSKQWEISRVNWINDKSFILEVYDQTKKDDNGMDIPADIRYLKATIK